MGSHSLTGHAARQGFADICVGVVPSLVQWLVTTECHLSCPHCLASAAPGDETSTPLELARSLVDQIADAAVPELLLTGGEPLAYRFLPEVLAHMAERGVRWSLNTTRAPTGAVLEAIERHPPEFAAVSLDGPPRVHDAFRGRIGAFAEALEAMRVFRSLGSRVAAGTTVTRRNLDHLTETLAIVQDSAAHGWGLHLLVPEGRARHRPDLALRLRDLRRLVRFVQEKRSYVSVEMADELGHCGAREPLLRDLPMTCGAGRFQCVVLPDGEVVPCTTLDRAASAGNLRARPLLDIWRDGFAALRCRAAPRRCAGCDYFSACGGGCWLQTRERSRCFKDVWESDGLRGRAAGLVVALGLMSAPGCGGGASAPDARVAQPVQDPRGQSTGAAEVTPVEPPRPGESQDPVATETPPDDEPPPPPDPPVRTVSVRDPPFEVSGPRGDRVNLTAEMGSSLEAAIVRIAMRGSSAAVAQEVRRATPAGAAADPAWILVRTHAAGRLPQSLAARARAVREALGTSRPSLGLCALGWRLLSETLLDGPPPQSRSPGDRAAVRETLAALERTAETWRGAIFRGRLDPYLARGRTPVPRRFMTLKSRPEPPPELGLADDTMEERWGPQGARVAADWLAAHPYAEAFRLGLSNAGPGLTLVRAGGTAPVGQGTSMGVFDLLVVPPQGASLGVAWEQGAPLTIRLVGGSELAYADVVRLVDEQHRATLEPLAIGEAARGSGNPLLLPRMRARSDARAWLADFWLF